MFVNLARAVTTGNQLIYSGDPLLIFLRFMAQIPVLGYTLSLMFQSSCYEQLLDNLQLTKQIDFHFILLNINQLATLDEIRNKNVNS